MLVLACTLLLLPLLEAVSLAKARKCFGAFCLSTISIAPAFAAPIASESYNRAEISIESTQNKFKDMERAWGTTKKDIEDNTKVHL